jgi:hypothetical protein
MKPIYKIKYNSTGYFTYFTRESGKKRGIWDTHKPTASDLSQLPKDFTAIIKKRLKVNIGRYGRQIPSLICALYEAGKLCGWKPDIDRESQMIVWRISRNGGSRLSAVMAFQVLNWRWRKTEPKLRRKLLKSRALLRFVIDTNGRHIWSQKKGELD